MKDRLKKSMAVFLIALCPPSAMLMWYTMTALHGSVLEMGRLMAAEGPFTVLWNIWGPVFFGTPAAWVIIGIFAGTQLLFMRVMPGKEFRGPVTPKGNVPAYRANGVPSFAATMSLFVLCSFVLDLFPPAILYDRFGELLGAMNFFSLVFCLFLYFKGRFFPSSDDSGVTGNFIFDYYWGTELYPRVLGWDVKMFTNCRFGMMAWPLIIVSFAAAQHRTCGLSDSMAAAVAVQLVYIAKFFWWETGYLASMDIMHDRAGFYICWGCLVWVPAVYTSQTLYLVNHPYRLGGLIADAIFILGVFAVTVNYLADRQRQRVRASGGDVSVWGKKPRLIEAEYVTDAGDRKTSLLLASGWWGLSRHFHYIPEIAAAFFWTLPVLFADLLPWFYVIFLTILLTHRSVRDDRRCALKYGKYWDEYRRIVPNRIIPRFFPRGG